jgi:uncharacterized protein with GYD domain
LGEGWDLAGHFVFQSFTERRLLQSWAKAGKDSKGRSKAARSEGDDLGDSAARALMRHGGQDVVGEVEGVEEVGV